MSGWGASVGASDEWYTPASVFDALGCWFDLDVAHPLLPKPIPPCDGFLSADTLLNNDFFKVIATAIILTGWNGGPLSWAYAATKSGGEMATPDKW